MKPVLLSAILLACMLTSNAQKGCNVKKAFAFYTVTIPGMQMSDENGNPVPPVADIARFIYIECCAGNIPEIESVLYDNIKIPATIILTDSSTVIAGNKFEDNEPVKISAKKNNRLYKIELHPPAGDKTAKQNCRNIIITTKGAGKACKLRIQEETQLIALPRY